MTGTTFRDEGMVSLAGAFDSGARTVMLRGWVGTDAGDVALAYAAGKAREGKVLVIAPTILHSQVRRRLEEAAPGVAVGEWGDPDAAIELVSTPRAGRDAGLRDPVTFGLVVVEENHEPFHGHARQARARFTGAAFVEVVRMPHPHQGALDHDAEVHVGH